MKLGAALPHSGADASPDGMVTFAHCAEELGLDSLWVLERILRPVAPAREPLLPAHSASVYSPLETLAFIAGKTDVIRLGTSVLDALFHVPAALGRQLATVDRLSNGRLLVGLGQGWSTEEFQTAGIPMSRRGQGFEDFIAARRATWRPDPVQYQGRFYQIPPSEVGPKPVQAGGPQLLIGTLPGAVAPAQRAGRLGLGFNPVILDWDPFATQLRAYREAAGAAPGPVVVRVNGPVTAEPLGDGRTPLTGSVEEVRDDLARAAELGVDQVFWDLIAANVPHSGLLDALNSIADLRG
jgi:alkanesulfonate monooxygenase SsuD/methylene tetrahydromethanopterin reductase-like flavin-dependent oxidoreductase (luciferase family)